VVGDVGEREPLDGTPPRGFEDRRDHGPEIIRGAHPCIITSFSVGKWLPTAGAFARFLLLGLFTISVIVYAVQHGAHGLGASDYKPSTAGFVLLVGVLLFNFVGFELPNSAGEEMTTRSATCRSPSPGPPSAAWCSTPCR
jgi:hypothetical protein